jgi:NDP-sugar pyrophosphorylase family protein
MQTVVIAHGISSATKGLNERYPTPMLPLVDRPFIQHVLELIIEQGGTDVDVVLSHLPERIENLLGDGSKWGIRIRYHLAMDPSHPYDILKCINLNRDSAPVLLVHADRLPQVDLSPLIEDYRDNEIVMFCLPAPLGTAQDQDEAPLNWTGWALVSGGFFDTLPLCANEQSLECLLYSASKNEGRIVEVTKFLDVRTYKGLLDSNRMILNKEFKNIAPCGKETEPGIWISRNVSVHSSARLYPPVFVGENSLIGKGTSLGPFAVIGRNCILDSASKVTESIVAPDSHVGEALDLENVIVDKNWLVNVRLGAEVAITDNFILGSLSRNHAKRKIEGLMSRSVGIALLLIMFPLLLLIALFLKLFRKGPVFFTKEAIKLPTSSDESFWQSFLLFSFLPHQSASVRKTQGRLRGEAFADLFLRLVPSLINVAAGEMRFVGLTPRTRDEILNLGEDWKALYLGGKLGIITEAFVRYGSQPTEDELYSAEAVYSVMGGPWYDFKLGAQYLKKVFLG